MTSEYYALSDVTVSGQLTSSSQHLFAKPTQVNQVMSANGYQTSASYKAYTSIQWKSNTQESPTPVGEWANILSNVAPVLGVDSGNCQINDLTGGDYSFTYIDPVNNLSRIFLCSINFGIDFSQGGSTKIVEFRLTYNGTPLTPFLQIESNKDGESASNSVLLPMNPDDVIDCQICNITNSDPIIVRFFSIVVTEI